MEEKREDLLEEIEVPDVPDKRKEDGYLDRKTRKILMTVAPLVIALISIFVIARYATSVSFYADTIAALDQKKETVLQLTAVSTGASAAITLIPGDVATPIADKLADLSSYFIIVLCAIYLEKYLLTITGFAAFVILIPIACVLFSLFALFKRPGFLEVAKKLLLFGIAIVLVIPSSVGVSNMIEKTYSESIDLTLQQAIQATESVREDMSEAALSDESTNAAEAGQDMTESEAVQEEGNWFQNFVTNASETVTSTVQNALDSTVSGVEQKIDEFKNMLNRMIEALAVMIVTSCLIPVIVLLFFVWLIKVILNVSVPMPPMGKPGGLGRRPL
ncbi:MAG: hypothetical protein Q4A32_10395 [Lachnospiraceae bacterium]|nr:hypothetical protein [Lachnospiraceae bacterium]